jgi:hypothetical protein
MKRALLVPVTLALGAGCSGPPGPSDRTEATGSVAARERDGAAGGSRDGAVELDAGPDPIDAGETPLDAGPGPIDAGFDAGSPPEDCHALLDWLGLDWSVAGASRGIADPVRVEPVIGGVRFRYVDSASPTAMLMDCSLAPRLVRLAELVTPYGIDEVIHIGIYNYRCIGGGDPDVDGCTPSQHAYATAIDLHAFGLAGSDVEYSTETDWIIRSDLPDVCPGEPAGMADRVLHEIACGLWSGEIFNIVLTPDYNAAHRNHFHVDLTPGSMFIGEGVTGVDPLVPGLGD